ncbi:MAG: hypothetical protein E7262_06155 [Lachnospiraceae bacterium]|nr:hypothetical protein [Lachnospiraceae bacterium]
MNINAEMNYTIKEHCKKLKDYCTYVEKIREYKRDMSIGEAVENAIDYCISNDILKDFLRDQRAEVTYMSIFEFNEEEEMEKYKRAEREVGREEERALIIKNLLKKEYAIEEISDIVGISQDEIKEYVDLEIIGE